MKNIIVLFLLICSYSFGQFTPYSDPNPANYRFLPEDFDTPFGPIQGSTNWRQNLVYNITGTPYILDDYNEGTTTILNKKGFTAPMRYNAAKDVVEFLDDKKITKELLRRPYIKATFDGKTYEVISYMKNEEERLAYFNRLNTGKTQLLFKPKKIVKPSTQKFQGKIQASYKDASMYYLKREKQPAQMVHLDKINLLIVLHDQKEAVTKFISDYKLNVKKEADAVRLIEYYNTLRIPKPFEKKGQC